MKNKFFPSFDSNINYITVLTLLGVLLSVLLYKKNLTGQELRELSSMCINVQIVLAALVIAVLQIKKDIKEDSVENILSYIGYILFSTLIGIVGYLLSYQVDCFYKIIIKIYSIVISVLFSGGVAEGTKYIYKIFYANKKINKSNR